MTDHHTTVSFARGTAPVTGTAVFEIYIKATPEQIWEAITDPVLRATFSFGVQTHSEWTTGSAYRAGVTEVVLTVVHDQLPASANAELYGGWPMILTGLKTLIETGERLTTPGSLMHAQGAASDHRP